MTIADLDTPALLIDLDIMERNLQRMADYARQHNLRLRPHTKTHKIPALGQRQLALGAAGLTVAKVSEAEVMLRSGTPDLLIAYPTLGASKLTRLREVAQHTNVTMSIDSKEVADQLAGLDIGVLVEIDVGLGRVGIDPGQPAADLAKHVDSLPGLRFEGIAFYPGQFKSTETTEMAEMETKVSAAIADTLAALGRAGLEAKIVSGGSTPTWAFSDRVHGMNEMRPGTYIFNDRNCVIAGSCSWDDCAATILTTVVSTARPGQMILDGGSKTFSSDRTSLADVTYGVIQEDKAARFHKMNEEHGYVDITKCERSFRVGDRVQVIPNHVCVAVNLHEQIYGVRQGRVEEVWKVEGRGKLQ